MRRDCTRTHTLAHALHTSCLLRVVPAVVREKRRCPKMMWKSASTLRWVKSTSPVRSARHARACARPHPCASAMLRHTHVCTRMCAHAHQSFAAVDEYRHSLDRKLDSTVSAMTSLVEATLLRMPARIKHMSMKEFMLEFE
ncbi:hypothetical protein EON67_08760, partial [archaeon]